MNKHYFSKALLAFALLFSTAAFTYGQCVIPITDSQPYIEDFEGDGFNCWTVEANGGNWTLLPGSNTTLASFTYENNGDEARLISPTLDLSAVDGATFGFSYAMMGLYENDVLEVSYRTSENDPWHLLGSFSFSDYQNFFEETFELENLSATYQVSFLGRGLGGMYIFVDNIEISSTMGCTRPISLQATEITGNSALLSWSTTGNEENWTLDLNGTMIDVTEQPYLIENLRPQTDYTVSVQANCGGDSTSEWATPITFTTMCDLFVVTDETPFFDDFEADEDFVCWQNEIISGTDPWVVDPGYLILNNTAFFIWLGGEARLVSPTLDLSEVSNPTLVFRHKQLQGSYGVEELFVWYRTAPDEAWQPLEVYIYATDWATETIALPNPSATYQIGFNGIGHNGEGLYVDDVWVGKGEDTGVEELPAIAASVNPNPTSGWLTVEANVSDGEIAVFDVFGKQVATAVVDGGRAKLDLSGCAKGVYVARITNDSATAAIKIVKE